MLAEQHSAVCVGPTNMPDLPASLQDAIFCRCDVKSQYSLAQTCRVFWNLYHHVKCVPLYPGCQPTYKYTACHKWRQDATEAAAARFARQFRADMPIKALKPTFLPDNDSCYHASLVGHLSQRHLHFLLQHPQPEQAWAYGYFSEHAVNRLDEALKVDANNATRIVLFTLKVYHSRQAGFSDDELDKLGAVFRSFPIHTRLWLWETPLAEGSDETVTLICEPYWQLMSPSKQASCMEWNTQDAESIDHVAELSEILDC